MEIALEDRRQHVAKFADDIEHGLLVNFSVFPFNVKVRIIFVPINEQTAHVSVKIVQALSAVDRQREVLDDLDVQFVFVIAEKLSQVEENFQDEKSEIQRGRFQIQQSNEFGYQQTLVFIAIDERRDQCDELTSARVLIDLVEFEQDSGQLSDPTVVTIERSFLLVNFFRVDFM